MLRSAFKIPVALGRVQVALGTDLQRRLSAVCKLMLYQFDRSAGRLPNVHPFLIVPRDAQYAKRQCEEAPGFKISIFAIIFFDVMRQWQRSDGHAVSACIADERGRAIVFEQQDACGRVISGVYHRCNVNERLPADLRRSEKSHKTPRSDHIHAPGRERVLVGYHLERAFKNQSLVHEPQIHPHPVGGRTHIQQTEKMPVSVTVVDVDVDVVFVVPASDFLAGSPLDKRRRFSRTLGIIISSPSGCQFKILQNIQTQRQVARHSLQVAKNKPDSRRFGSLPLHGAHQ